jgi:hypothetical protein
MDGPTMAEASVTTDAGAGVEPCDSDWDSAVGARVVLVEPGAWEDEEAPGRRDLSFGLKDNPPDFFSIELMVADQLQLSRWSGVWPLSLLAHVHLQDGYRLSEQETTLSFAHSLV